VVKIPKDIKSPCVETEELKDYLILLEEREKSLLNELCGMKYSREKHGFKRYKTRVRAVFTRFGKVKRKFVYVKGKNTEQFSPLLRWLGINKNQHISEDFKRVLADKPSKMTYRKSAEDVRNSFNFSVSSMTLHKYVKETNSSVHIEQEPDSSHKVLLADGTKVKGSKMKHDVRTIVSIGDNGSGKRLLKQAINRSWKEMSEEIDLSQYKVFVGDGEPGLSNALCTNDMEFHYCHEHAKRDLAFFLWKGGLRKKEYTLYTKQFEGVLHCLQNSTKKHKEDKNYERLISRIAWTRKEVNTLAVTLSCRGFNEAAGFLMRNKEYFTTAAKMAVVGIDVPWTTNQMERVMQEIGIRTKKKGMYWSDEGLDRILKIVLKRYFLPKERRYYKEIFATPQVEAVKN